MRVIYVVTLLHQRRAEVKTLADTSRIIYLTDYDFKRLSFLLKARKSPPAESTENLRMLQNELARAIVVRPENIPAKTITMNSVFSIRESDSDSVETYTLVFPKQADIGKKKLSVLSPLGAAAIGYKAGDSFRYLTPSGLRHALVKDVLFQPEANGRYNL